VLTIALLSGGRAIHSDRRVRTQCKIDKGIRPVNKQGGLRILTAAVLGLTGLAASFPGSALAAREVTIEACVVERKPTSALMTPGDQVFFEVDLRGVANNQFAMNPDECVTIVGLDRDNEPGLRREFPKGSWLVEAQVIQAPSSPSPRNRSEPDHDS
jgi:hypothetical protein